MGKAPHDSILPLGVGSTQVTSGNYVVWDTPQSPPSLHSGRLREVSQLGPVVVGLTDPAALATETFRTQEGIISSSPSATDSVVMGRGALASVGATDSIAIGRGAAAQALQQVVIGAGTARAQSGAAVAVGFNAHADAVGAVAIGPSSAASGNNGTAVGTGTLANGGGGAGGASAFGQGAQAVDVFATAIGQDAQATAIAATAIGQGTRADANSGMAFGCGANTNGFSSLSIGFNALPRASNQIVCCVGGNSPTIAAGMTGGCIVFTGGSGVNLQHADNIVVGIGAISYGPNVAMIGAAGTPITEMCIGRGNLSTVTVPAGITIRGTNGSGADLAMGGMTVTAPIGTGSATPGAILLQVGEVQASGSTSHVVRTGVAVLPSVTPGDTLLGVWDVSAATLKTVSVGAADSGGVGFRLLRVVN